MTEFPNRVWEPTGRNEHGEPLWASHEPTEEDKQRRLKYIDRKEEK